MNVRFMAQQELYATRFVLNDQIRVAGRKDSLFYAVSHESWEILNLYVYRSPQLVDFQSRTPPLIDDQIFDSA